MARGTMKSARARRMAEIWDEIRAALGRTDPVRAEAMRTELIEILILIRLEVRKWEGKGDLPIYGMGALWDRLGADPVAVAKLLKVAEKLQRQNLDVGTLEEYLT